MNNNLEILAASIWVFCYVVMYIFTKHILGLITRKSTKKKKKRGVVKYD